MAIPSIAGYAAAVGVAAATPFLPVPYGISTLLVLVVGLLGLVVTAIVMQADSAFRADAYWATLPFHRAAVAAAKFTAVIAGVIGIGLVGQLIALLAYDLPAARLADALLASALTYGAWIATGAVIATVTRDLRSFLVAQVILIVGYQLAATFIVMGILGGDLPAFSILAQRSAGIAGLLVAAGLIARVYRTRRRAAVVWLAVPLLFGVPWGVGFAIDRSAAPAPDVQPPRAAATAAMPVPSVRVLSSPALEDMDIVLQLPGSFQHAYAVTSLKAAVRLPDGSTSTRSLSLSAVLLKSAGDIRVERGDDVTAASEAQNMAVHVRASFDAEQREAVRNGTARVTVSGRMLALAPRAIGSLPLRVGASISRNGFRWRIDRMNTRGSAIELRFAESTVVREDWSPSFDSMRRIPRYLLVNDARSEVVALDRGGGGGSGVGLVLPGPELSIGTVALRAAVPGEGESDRTDWLAGARLVIIDWATISSYPISVDPPRTSP